MERRRESGQHAITPVERWECVLLVLEQSELELKKRDMLYLGLHTCIAVSRDPNTSTV